MSTLWHLSNTPQDSDRDGRSGMGSGHNAQTHATAGSGSAQNTSGPHNSDLMNKADPRVGEQYFPSELICSS